MTQDPHSLAREAREPHGTAPRVRMQIFPLAADRATLTEFCNRWFNRKLPPEIAYFRPTFPVVFCTVLTYGDMSQLDRWRTGIHSQNEIYFLVPLDHLRVIDGRRVLIRRGVTTPFIYVDNAFSVMEGRQRFGFPKQLCVIDDGTSEVLVPWAADADTYLTVRVERRDADDSRPLDTFIQIIRNVDRAVPGFDDATDRLVPPRDDRVSRADVIWWAQTLLREIGHVSEHPLEELGASVVQEAWSALTGELPVESYNIRQLRNPSDDTVAYYTDLVRFSMRLRRLQNFSFFPTVQSPTPFSIVINRRAAQPIVDLLGLRVAFRERRSQGDGENIYDILDPIAPLYVQGDVILQQSERLAWQYTHGVWEVPEGRYRAADHAAHAPPLDTYLGELPTLSARSMTDTKYLLLGGTTAKIQAAIDALIPADCPLAIRADTLDGATPVRLSLRRSRPADGARARNPHRYDGTTLSISVPVTFDDRGQRRAAIFRIQDLVENTTYLAILAEAYGSPLAPALFETARDDWLTTTQPARHHVTVSTMILERSAQEARVGMRPWLRIFSTAAPPASQTDPLVDRFALEMARIHPTMVFGRIPDPSGVAPHLERRAAIAFMADVDMETPTRAVDPGRAHYLALREAELFPLVATLGLTTVPAEGLLSPAAQETFDHVIPVLAVHESSSRIATSEIRILWSDRHPLHGAR